MKLGDCSTERSSQRRYKVDSEVVVRLFRNHRVVAAAARVVQIVEFKSQGAGYGTDSSLEMGGSMQLRSASRVPTYPGQMCACGPLKDQ